MSTRKDAPNPFETESDQAPSRNSSPRRRRRWPWILALLLVGGVYFLPNIISRTALKQSLIDYVLADFGGTVSVQKLSLGWLSPIEVFGISAVDGRGQQLIEVVQVKTSLPLYAFLAASDYGELVIEQPTIYLRLRPDGSNLEDSIAKMLSAQERPANPEPVKLPRLKVSCNNGRALVTSTVSNEQWTIDAINAIVKTSTDNVPLAVEVQCQFTSGGSPTGGLAINWQVDAGSDLLSFKSTEIAMNSQNAPLALAAPLMNRLVSPISTTGYMTGELELAYDASTNEVVANIQRLEVTDAGFAAPGLIGEDRLYSKNISARGKISVSPRQISATQFQLTSEIASIKADGDFNMNQLAKLVHEGEVVDTPFHMEGKFDLARIATMLPNTLQLHNDLVIHSGAVSFQATSRQLNQSPDGNQRHMVFNIDTANIRAKRGGQNIIWQKPLRLVGTVNQKNSQFVLEDVRLESDFLEMQGSGSLQTGNITATGDLSKLVERVSQFADLGGVQLAGTLNGQFGWQIESDPAANKGTFTLRNRPIQIGGRFDISNPSVKWPHSPPWQHQQFSIQLQGSGRSLDENNMQLDHAKVIVRFGKEQLTAELTEPIANIRDTRALSLDCHLTGDVANWMDLAKNFVALGEIESKGNVNLTWVATIDSEFIRLNQVEYEIDSFSFDGFGLSIREPRVAGKFAYCYQFAEAQMLISQLSVNSRSILVNSRQFQITFNPNFQFDGDIEFRGDVHRIADWYDLSPGATDTQWYGTLEGNAQFASNQNGIGARINSRITDLVAVQQVVQAHQTDSPMRLAGQQTRWKEVWRDALVSAESTLVLSNDFETVHVQKLNIDSTSLKADAEGRIAQSSGAFLADLRGTWSPNWQAVNSLLASSAGKTVRFTGTSAQPFSIKGPLFPTERTQGAGWVDPQLVVNTSLAWDAVDIFTFVLGANKLNISLNRGIAYLSANPFPFSGGTFNIAPQLDLRNEDPILFINKGVVADRIQLTPEMCRHWLKYVAPLIADATTAQGTVTISSDGAQVPLLNPAATNARGSIRLSKVTIGPGPLAQQLLHSVRRLRSLLKPNASSEMKSHSSLIKIPEQDVSFAIQDNRIFHEGMTFNYRGLEIRTRGSVGFDQTLNMVAEIPLPDRWLKGERWLQGLKGKSVSIPISGTLAAPRLDHRAMEQLVLHGATNAFNQTVGDKLGDAQRAINGQVNDGLDKAQKKLNETLQKDFGEKLENEFFDGLNGLFKKEGDKK